MVLIDLPPGMVPISMNLVYVFVYAIVIPIVGFFLIMMLASMSGGWVLIKAKLTRKMVLLMQAEHGPWGIYTASAQRGWLKAKGGYYLAIPQASPSLKGTQLGVGYRGEGLIIRPQDVDALNVFKDVGFNNSGEVELFQLYCADATLFDLGPDAADAKMEELKKERKDFLIYGDIKFSEVVDRVAELHGFHDMDQMKAYLKKFDDIIPDLSTKDLLQTYLDTHKNQLPIIFRDGLGLGARCIGKVVRYIDIKNYLWTNLPPDKINTIITLEKEADKREEGKRDAIKWISVGILIFLMLLGATILLSVLGGGGLTLPKIF